MRGGEVAAVVVGLAAGVAAWALWVRPRAPAPDAPTARAAGPDGAGQGPAVAAPAASDPDARPRARPAELEAGPGPDPAPAAPASAPPPAAPVAAVAPPVARFTTYRTAVQGREGGTPLQITVDLAAKARAPDPGYPQLLQLTIQMIGAGPDGLLDLAAESQLDAIAAAIRTELTPALRAWYVGVLRRDGAETHYLYCPADAELDSAHEALERRFDRHTWLPFAQEDPAWTSYLSLLYPAAGEGGD